MQIFRCDAHSLINFAEHLAKPIDDLGDGIGSLMFLSRRNAGREVLMRHDFRLFMYPTSTELLPLRSGQPQPMCWKYLLRHEKPVFLDGIVELAVVAALELGAPRWTHMTVALNRNAGRFVLP